jgi:hypothetical protein
MRQGSSSRAEMSSSMRNFTPPFPEFADYNNRRSSRPQSLRSSRALGINYHLLSPSMQQSSTYRLLSPSMRQGSSSRAEMSSSMRNFTPPFPEFADYNNRRSSRPQSLQSSQALGINYHLLSPSMQQSSSSRLLSPSMRQGSSSCEISSSMRNFTPPFPEFADYNSRRSSRPQSLRSIRAIGINYHLLSPSMQLSSGSRLLSPSMRQGSSSREISSSMRNFTPPFPEFADYNNRRSSRPQSLRSSRALGINYDHGDSGDIPELPSTLPLSLSSRDGSFRGDVPNLSMTPSRRVQLLPKGLLPEERQEASTPISRRKTRQVKRIDLIANMLGFDGESSPKLPVYDLSPMRLCKSGGELHKDSDDEESACDSMTDFVEARLLDPATKKKRLQVSLHQMGESFKNNLSKPVKNYVKTRNQKTTNEWSLYLG